MNSGVGDDSSTQIIIILSGFILQIIMRVLSSHKKIQWTLAAEQS
jgi:hypothetical protein